MLLEIDHHSGVPIYRQVVSQIRQQIVTGGLRQGDKLETVRDLARRLKVNPMTISKAYSFLQMEGLVERNRGIGLFVAKAKKGRKEKIRARLLEDAINKAAVTVIQLGVSKEEAAQLFLKQYKEFDTKKRRRK